MNPLDAAQSGSAPGHGEVSSSPAWLRWAGRTYDCSLRTANGTYWLDVEPRRLAGIDLYILEEMSFPLQSERGGMSDWFALYLDWRTDPTWIFEPDEVKLRALLADIAERWPRQYTALALRSACVPYHRIAVLMDCSETAARTLASRATRILAQAATQNPTIDAAS